MSREEALKILETPPLNEEESEELYKEVAKRLEISKEELQKFYNLPRCTEKFKNQNGIYNFGIKLFELLGIEKRIRK